MPVDYKNDPGFELAEQLFSALYPEGIPDGLYLPIWFLNDKRTEWCKSAEGAAAAAISSAGRSDVFFGVSLQDREAAIQENGETSRGTSATAGAIGGLWLDLDVLGPNHKATDLPPTVESARELLAEMVLEPTAIVSSGGGLQAYWMFVESWVFDGVEDRAKAAALSASWISTFQARAEKHGWSVDSTMDLARVLRVPGTYNLKLGGHVPVTVDFFPHRYNPSDFDEHVFLKIPASAKLLVSGGGNGVPLTAAHDGDVYTAQCCLKVIPAAMADNRDDWIRIGVACKAMNRDAEIFPAWLEWSRKSTKFDEIEATDTWNSFKPTGAIGIGSLIYAARKEVGVVAGYDDVEIGSALQRAAPTPVTAPQAIPALPPPVMIPAPSATAQSAPRVRIANMVDAKIEDGNGGEKWVKYYVELPDIAAALNTAAVSWPRRVGKMLFVPGDESKDLPDYHSVQYMLDVDDLFAWMQKQSDIRWGTGDVFHAITHDKLSAATKREFFKYLKDNASPCYRSVEALPHVPPVEGAYYLPCRLPEIDHHDLTTPLWELVSRFNAETEQDRMLMLAALMTPGWGGPPGTRPAFVFTSTHGMGVGKSATATVLSEIWGGGIGIGASEDWDQVKKRLLGDESLAKRICIIDNLKGKLSGGDIEGAITAKEIDGWKPYHGQSSRPNYLTWYLTANSPALSRDLANRSIIIKLGAAQHGEDFIGWAEKFIPVNRPAILSEIYKRLEAPPRCLLSKSSRDRWGGWQSAILARLDDGDGLAKMIAERRPDVDSDLDDSDDIARAVISLVSEFFADHETRRIFITRKQLFNRLLKEGVTDRSLSPKGVTTWVRNHCNIGPLRCLTELRIAGSRGWCYFGREATSLTRLSDIPETPESSYGWDQK
jgi:hypothetical protein